MHIVTVVCVFHFPECEHAGTQQWELTAVAEQLLDAEVTP